MKTLILISLVLFIQTSHAIDFDSIEIPGAKCGDGSDYKVFLNKGRSDKLLIEFMGGGVCWDKESCSVTTPRAWIFPIPNINFFSIFTADVKDNPFRECKRNKAERSCNSSDEAEEPYR